jgi:hypothetical protein
MVSSIVLRTRQDPTVLKRLQWWEWFHLAGAVALVGLLAALLVTDVPALIVAVALHLACDFTFQSSETAIHKGERGRHLVVHALCAGALPHLLAGLTVNASTGLIWGVIGFLAHYAIDFSRKFGVKSVALGATLDQAAHVLTILALAL